MTAVANLHQSPESSPKAPPYNPSQVRHLLLGEPLPEADNDVKDERPQQKQHSAFTATKSSSTSVLFQSPTIFPHSLAPTPTHLHSMPNSIWNSMTTEKLWEKTTPTPAPAPRPVHVVKPREKPSQPPPQPERTRPKTIRSFNARLNSYAQKGNYNEVLSLIEGVRDGLIEVTGPLNTYSYTILVKAYCNAGNLTAARDLLETMRGFEPSQRPNRFTYNTVLNACVRWDDMASASALFAIMDASDDDDVQPDHVTYTTLMKGFAVSGDMASAEQLLHRLRNHPDPSCRPNQVTYNTMLKGFASVGDMSAADRVLADMRDPMSGCAPDIVSMNTIIGGHARKGDMASAAAYLESMAPLEPNSVTFHAMIEGYTRVDDLDSAEALFRRCEASGDASALSYQTMIGSWIRKGDMKSAENAFYRQRTSGDVSVMPNQTTYTMMIGAYAEAGMMEVAESVVDEVRALTGQPGSIRLTASIFESLVAAYIASGNLAQAESCLNEMQHQSDRNCHPTRTVLNMLMEAYASRQQVAAADHLLAFMNSHPDPNCRPNHITYQICSKLATMQ